MHVYNTSTQKTEAGRDYEVSGKPELLTEIPSQETNQQRKKKTSWEQRLCVLIDQKVTFLPGGGGLIVHFQTNKTSSKVRTAISMKCKL